EVVPDNPRFRAFAKSFHLVVACERSRNRVERNSGEVERWVAPTGIAPVNQSQQPALMAAHNIPLVQVIVNETVGAATPRNKGAEIGDEMLDFADSIATPVTGVGELLEDQVKPQFTPRRIQVSVGVLARPHPVV